MPQPIDYLAGLQRPNLTAQLLGEFGTALGERKTRLAREAQIDAAQKQQQATQKQQQAATDALTNLGSLENPTFEDYNKVALLMPKDRADSIRASWDMLSKTEKENQLKFTGQTLAAFDVSPDFAIDLLTKRAEAERNAGDEEEAAEFERLAEGAKTNPEGVKKYLGTISSLFPGGKEMIESVGKIGVEERQAQLQPGIIKKQVADLGLTDAQAAKALAGAKKLGIESKKAVLELESVKKGELTPEKKFDQEKKLRDEFAKKTVNFVDGKRNYEVIKSSAADNSGAGDVALVTSFMKMLDPGSVVRETEFANARDTAGLMEQLKNQAQKIQTGQFLGTEQRAAFSRLAKQYLDAAQKQQEGVKKDLGVIVKNYNLNEDNVFGIGKEEPIEGVTPLPTTPAEVRSKADAILGAL